MFWICIFAAILNDVTFLTKGDNSYFFLGVICFLSAAVNYTITPELPPEEEDNNE